MDASALLQSPWWELADRRNTCMSLASINFGLLCIYASKAQDLFRHGSVENFGTSWYSSVPLSVSALLTFPSCPSFLSLLPPVLCLLFFLFPSIFIASSAFDHAYCMNHQPLSENKISSVNGQRAFSALLAKSRDLNKQVL